MIVLKGVTQNLKSPTHLTRKIKYVPGTTVKAWNDEFDETAANCGAGINFVNPKESKAKQLYRCTMWGGVILELEVDNAHIPFPNCSKARAKEAKVIDVKYVGSYDGGDNLNRIWAEDAIITINKSLKGYGIRYKLGTKVRKATVHNGNVFYNVVRVT